MTKLILIIARSFMVTQRLHSYQFTLVAVRCIGRHYVVRMRTRSLVPKPIYHSWSGSETSAHVKSQVDQAAYVCTAGTVIVTAKAYARR